MSDLFSELRNDRKKMKEGPTASWEIRDPEGVIQAIHIRFDGPDGKKVLWKLPGADRWGLEGRGLDSLPLYGSERVKDWPDDMPIILTEGEKAADALLAAHIPAVGTVTGASSTPAEQALSVLAGRKVVLWPDNDEAGRAHMERIAAKLHGTAKEVSVFEWKEAPEGGDAVDHPAVLGKATSVIAALFDEIAATPVRQRPEFEPSTMSGVFTAVDLMSERMPPTNWAVPGIVPEGVTLFAGKPKMGKSWMALGLCVAVASRGVALGSTVVEQGEVLYMALEDNRRRLRRRLGKLLANEGMPSGLHIATDWPRAGEGGIDKLRAFLREHPGCRLVVIDTLARFKPRTNARRTQYDDDRDAVDPLIPIAAEHNVAILLVHHLREAESDDPLDMIHGSAGLTGGVDGAMILKRDRGKADAYLFVDGRDIEDTVELALRFDHNTATWVIIGNAEDYRMSEQRRAILRVLEESEKPLGPADITRRVEESGVKVSNDTVRQLLRKLLDDGQVTQPNYGLYEAANAKRNVHSDHTVHRSREESLFDDWDT